jgi:hypothetical protein
MSELPEAVHHVSRIIELDLAESSVLGLMPIIAIELVEMRAQLPYANRLFLRLEWIGPSEEVFPA